MSQWDDAAGVLCPECGQETLRLIDGKCPSCYQAMVVKEVEKAEDKSMRRIYSRKMREGTISLKEMREGRL